MCELGNYCKIYNCINVEEFPRQFDVYLYLFTLPACIYVHEYYSRQCILELLFSKSMSIIDNINKEIND